MNNKTIMNNKKKLLLGLMALGLCASMQAQVTERQRPAEWAQLVPGARFMDRFLPGFQLTLDELQRCGEELIGQTQMDLTSGKDGQAQ